MGCSKGCCSKCDNGDPRYRYIGMCVGIGCGIGSGVGAGIGAAIPGLGAGHGGFEALLVYCITYLT